VARGGVAVNQPLSSGTVEELDRGKTLFGGTTRSAFEGSAEGRALRAIPNRSGAGFPHVLLG
jgi:hypothetical protein